MYIPANVETSSLDNEYSYAIMRNKQFDGLRMLHDDECNIGKYINSAHGTSQNSNCKASQPQRFKYLVFMVATRRIEIGDELLSNYNA